MHYQSCDRNDIKVGYNGTTPTILQVTIKKPKLYGTRFESEITLSECTCMELRFCALHQFITLFQLVKPQNLTQAAFMITNDNWLTHTTMSRIINYCCNQTKLDCQYYAPHGFRSGKCTDMKRKGIDETIICKLGRWTSDVWKTHYLKLDMFDILRLSK